MWELRDKGYQGEKGRTVKANKMREGWVRKILTVNDNLIS
jgi:hypothetical protein